MCIAYIYIYIFVSRTITSNYYASNDSNLGLAVLGMAETM